ncbi:unnamed protein product, partial [Mesorhabditis spiculigera]
MGGPRAGPPGVDPRRGKLMCVKVRLLDESVAVFHLGQKATGQTLLEEVARHLNLLESDYFGLEFVDNEGCHVWLDKDKTILRQIAGTTDVKFHLIVKFYTPNPMDLEEEYTRYLLSLQIRRDLSQGHFLCADSTAALLAAYFVQSDCGDFSPDDYPDPSYLSHTRFVPNQTIHFQQKVMECHKKLIGLTPEDADMQMLEVARRCDFYGIKLHPAKDIEGTEACLAVMHLGIKVFHQFHCVSTFSWAKIRKLSFKRKKLLIKLHPDSYQCYKETIEFYFETRNECKNFWKKCVEHHGFFRCVQVEFPRKDTKLFSKGSAFRFHGRTQRQLIDYVREHHKRREPFTRPLRSGYHTCGVASSVGGAMNKQVHLMPDYHDHDIVIISMIVELFLMLKAHLPHALDSNESTRRRDGEVDLDSILNTNDSTEMFESDYGQSTSEVAAVEKIRQDLRIQERTLLRDAVLISKVLHQRILDFTKEYYLLGEMFTYIDAISSAITRFIQDLDALETESPDLPTRFATLILAASGPSISKQDALLRNMTTYISAFYQLYQTNTEFRRTLREFEQSPECYLPVVWLLVRVMNRLFHWQEAGARIVETLLSFGHGDAALGTARMAVDSLAHHAAATAQKRKLLYDFATLLEIEKALTGISPLTHPDRQLLVAGRVSENCGIDFIPSLLLLFNDSLIIARQSANKFAVLKVIQMHTLKSGSVSQIIHQSRNCFALQTIEETLIFASKNCQAWAEELTSAIKSYTRQPPSLLKIEMVLGEGECVLDSEIRDPNKAQSLLASCWSKGGTLRREEVHQMAERWRAGLVLRKLKTSSGWQKLFVLHAHGHLFFFNSHKDPSPMIALNLIDYTVSVPTLQDNIAFRNVVKLSHQQVAYFFRTDSHYAFLRWIESLQYSCSSRRPLDALTALSVHL